MYGVLNDKTKKMDSNSITDMVEGERRRWRHADIEGDDALNIVEFQVETSKAIQELKEWQSLSVPVISCLKLSILIFLASI